MGEQYEWTETYSHQAVPGEGDLYQWKRTETVTACSTGFYRVSCLAECSRIIPEYRILRLTFHRNDFEADFP